MSKYYRVRTKVQWGWLMKWFEEQDENIKWSYNDKPTGGISDLLVGILLKRADIVVKLDNFTLRVGNVRNREVIGKKLIEVSQMMEGEKMEDYVTIKGEDLKNVEMFRGNESKGNLEEFWDVNKVNISKSLLYPKVRMSVAEEQELIRLHNDRLSKKPTDIRYLLNQIYNNKSFYPILWERMFGKDVPTTQKINKQRDVVSAYFDNSLIEVIPKKKWNVKVPFIDDEFYYKNDDGGLYHAPVAHNHENNQQFTAEEIKYYHLDNDLFEKAEVKE